jgi:hypothetical protein
VFLLFVLPEDVVEVHVHNAGGWHFSTLLEQDHNGLHDHDGELDHLAHGQGRLPPNVFSVHRHKVVRVPESKRKEATIVGGRKVSRGDDQVFFLR